MIDKIENKDEINDKLKESKDNPEFQDKYLNLVSLVLININALNVLLVRSKIDTLILMQNLNK